jgi:hypothetical protein
MAESNISQVTQHTPPKGEKGQGPSRPLLPECGRMTTAHRRIGGGVGVKISHYLVPVHSVRER